LEHRHGAPFLSFAFVIAGETERFLLCFSFLAAFSHGSSIAKRIVYFIHKLYAFSFLFLSYMEALHA
jgi:hypothetical protein